MYEKIVGRCRAEFLTDVVQDGFRNPGRLERVLVVFIVEVIRLTVPPLVELDVLLFRGGFPRMFVVFVALDDQCLNLEHNTTIDNSQPIDEYVVDIVTKCNLKCL